MSSKLDNTIILPGTKGWEIWKGRQEKGYELSLASNVHQASELDKISAQRLIMGFPIREVLAVPFHVQTEDEAMFADLAEMHLEKSGIRPELDAGILTDVFMVNKQAGGAQLLSVVLSAPESGTMPLTSPTGFDVSARFFPLPANSVTLWCELGRWGFAVTTEEKLTYFQALSGKALGDDTVRDIRLAVMQLAMQGVHFSLENPTVWTSGDEFDPSEEEIQTLSRGLGAAVSVTPKPAPVMPAELSSLVPADVRAEQRIKAERLKRNIFIAALLCLYLGLAAYLAYGYFELNSKVENQEKEIAQLKVGHSSIQFFNDDWAQLSRSVDQDKWPLLALKDCAELIPAGQDLRFKVFDASADQIMIEGEAAELNTTSAYASKLKSKMVDYDWATAPSQSDAKTKRWKFRYDGTRKGMSNE